MDLRGARINLETNEINYPKRVRSARLVEDDVELLDQYTGPAAEDNLWRYPEKIDKLIFVDKNRDRAHIRLEGEGDIVLICYLQYFHDRKGNASAILEYTWNSWKTNENL